MSTPLSIPNSLGAAVYGANWATSNASSVGSTLVLTHWCYSMRRNGNPAAARMQSIAPRVGPNFHGLVDPTTPTLPYTVIIEDMVQAAITLGAPEVLFGWVDHITVGVVNTVVGVGFRAGADGIWHAFVNDCPGSVLPVTVRHDTTTSANCSAWHRLTIIIDGPTRTITWKIDGATVATFTPTAPLDQMGAAAAGLTGMVAACCPANVDVTVRSHPDGAGSIRLKIWARS